ncbi:gliding motility-associated C-terminal domain-containing protein [candidate division KSB1 bacterium]|nr:gliding motility-associated C-terminal domain-containing protein [candidate division KSB1 bacterium]
MRSGNEVLAVLVNANGLFNVGTADDKPLLYDFPNADFRSHVNVWLDGRIFTNDSSRSRLPLFTLLRPPEPLADSTIVCQYGFEGLLLEQRLRLEQYSDSTGALFIQYVLTNPTNAPHEMGLLLELDTKVNGNDKTPFLSNFGFRDDEVIFRGGGVPDFLQAFEVLPPEKGLVAKFTLTGVEGTRPNFIAIGDWVNLSKVAWDYAPSPFKYNDSAVLLRWDPLVIAPGASRTIGTYYGVGEVSSQTDTLTLSVIAPERLSVQGDTLAPNPFSVSVLVTNTGFATAHDVQARLVLPEDLKLAAGEPALKDISPRDLLSQTSGTATWTIHARCLPADSSFRMKVEVTSSDAPGNAVTRVLQVPSCFGPGFELTLQPKTQNLVAGETAHVLVQSVRRGNYNEEISLDLWPAIPGIDFTFSPARIPPGANAQLTFATRNTLVPGEYSFVVNGRSAALIKSDTVALHIAAAVIDVTPPFTRNHNPAQNARNVLPETALSFEVHDAGTGVDSAALALLVNGIRVQPKLSRLEEKSFRVEYQPSPFQYNDEVRVTIRAQDLASPANVMAEEDYSFAIVADLQPPFLTDLQPPREAPAVAANAEISFHVRDELAGVDSSSIILTVNGLTVQPSISGTRREALVRYRPLQPFRYNEQVQVSVRAKDLARPANEMPEERYTFTVVQDVTPPFITDLQPPREATRVAPDTEISFHVRDDLAGVDSTSLRLVVDGNAVRPKLSGTPQNLLVRHRPAQPFVKGQSVSVSIAARDLSSPPNAMPTEQYIFHVEDPVYDLIAANLQPLGELRAGVFVNISGEVRNGLDAVTLPFRVRFIVDGATVKDTLLAAFAHGQQENLAVPVRFVTEGKHTIEMRVDADDNIIELSESNNLQSLFVEILPPLVREFTVRPNPFTPNHDGFNDAVEFNFATLDLDSPALRIFDVDGVAVLSEDNLRAGLFIWNGRDRHGRELPPGIYLYSLQDRGKNVANGYIVLAR